MVCKICASPRLRRLYRLNDYQIWQCAVCGFGQVDVTPEELAAFYDREYFTGDKARFGQSVEQDLSPGYAPWLDRQLALCHGAGAQPLAVLDIGPGLSVGFGRYLAEHHPQCTYEAIEISDFAARSIRERGFTVHTGRCVDPEIAAACRGRFDLVVGTEVIEHDPEPHRFIQAVHDMLKPGGRCAFTTGNLRGLMARVKGAGWYYLDPPAHVSYYTPDAAVRLFTQHGFTRPGIHKGGFQYIAMERRFHLPGLVRLVHALNIPTGMTMSAERPR